MRYLYLKFRISNSKKFRVFALLKNVMVELLLEAIIVHIGNNSEKFSERIIFRDLFEHLSVKIFVEFDWLKFIVRRFRIFVLSIENFLEKLLSINLKISNIAELLNPQAVGSNP